MSRAKLAHAYRLAETARSTDEIRAAHVAMVEAFPALAAAYPCNCHDCMVARRTKDAATTGGTS
jgi:hypothetical protein